MGIHFFKNAAFGGDWILQEKMVSLLYITFILYVVNLRFVGCHVTFFIRDKTYLMHRCIDVFVL